MKNHFHCICEQKFADQPARLRRLVSTFWVRFLDSILNVLATSEFLPVYVAEQTLLGLTCSLQRRPFFLRRDPCKRHHDNSTESLLSNREG